MEEKEIIPSSHLTAEQIAGFKEQEKEISSLLHDTYDQINFPWKQTLDINKQPVIGIVSQTIEAEMTDPEFEKYDSYIMASYVKYFEAQGARVVPLLIS